MALIMGLVPVMVVLGGVAIVMSRPVPLPLVSADGDRTRGELVGRFVARSQRYRRNGAIVGLVLVAAAVAARNLGPGGGASVHLDLYVLASVGLAGSIAGSVVAEGFRTRRPRGPRIASLDVRDPADYRDPVADRRERALLGLAAVGVAGSVANGHGAGRSLVLAAGVAGLAALRWWATRRIALRPRPVLASDVAAADDEVRRLAASVGLGRPMVTLGALLVSAQWFGVRSEAASPDRLGTLIDVVGFVGGLILFVVASRWWWTNRSFGLVPADSAVAPTSHPRWWAFGLVGAGIVSVVLILVLRSS